MSGAPVASSSAITASSATRSTASVVSPPSPRPSGGERAGPACRSSTALCAESAARRQIAGQSSPMAAAIRARMLGAMPTAAAGLTETQLEAVRHPAGPLLVVGGAGTGKTRVLIARFEWLAKHGTAPDAILALAHSASAADGMRERLESEIAAPFEELCVLT